MVKTSLTKQEEAERIINHRDSNLYKVLGVHPDATKNDIQKAYMKKQLKFHPDKNLNASSEVKEASKVVNLAKSILYDEVLREKYDHLGQMGVDHGKDFSRADLRRFLDQSKLLSEQKADIKELLRLYVDQFEAKVISVEEKGNDSLPTVNEDGGELDDDPRAPMLEVFHRMDNSASVIAVATLAIFVVFFSSSS
jgi:curved DNA-binding protein CbpA